MNRQLGQAAKVAIHIALAFVAFLTAYELRRGLPLSWWTTDPQAPQVLLWALLYTVLAGLVEAVFRTERASWRYASSREVLKLIRSTAVTTGIFLTIAFLNNRGLNVPRSMVVLAWLINLSLLVGVRLGWRLVKDPSLALSLISETLRTKSGVPLVLVGESSAAEAYLRQTNMRGDETYRPIGIIAPTSTGIGMLIHGVPMIGLTDDLIGHVKSVLPGDEEDRAILFLDDPISKLGLSSGQIGRLRTEGIKLMRQLSPVELQKESNGPSLREIQLEDFLSRAPVTLNPSPISELVGGKRVLVTGAGGSIGSEVARQLVGFGCSHITLIDHSEFLLFEIDRELQSLAPAGCTRRALLCNIREEDRVRKILKLETPDIVFHAAALKHVTLVENNPCEGVLTNVLGTLNVAKAAQECGVEQMVMISTDKAVNPTSVMGATKRIAESLLPALAGSRTRYCVVRFGNVLGSAGSVVPIFRSQIERGGPVTVTHPDVERYFMTIPEAVQLVLHATALSAASGAKTEVEKYVLEMGKPVKILQLAQRMIELNGQTPGREIRIEFTGLRPGEKITEELVDANELLTACIDGISKLRPHAREGEISPALIGAFRRLANAGDGPATRELVISTLKKIRGEAQLDDFPEAVAEVVK